MSVDHRVHATTAPEVWTPSQGSPQASKLQEDNAAHRAHNAPAPSLGTQIWDATTASNLREEATTPEANLGRAGIGLQHTPGPA